MRKDNPQYSLFMSTRMRFGILSFYEFPENASILDLSDGAYTQYFKDKNVRYSTELNGKFDYIILLDPEDFSQEYFFNLKSHLTNNGRLLIIYENPESFCFFTDKILSYESKSKPELSKLLKNIGFEKQKWFYPLSTHWFATEIYSENMLPEADFLDKFISLGDSDFYLNEGKILQHFLKKGLFEDITRSYFVECLNCTSDELYSVNYAKSTIYRNEDKQFATLVLDNEVKKIALNKNTDIKIFYENHKNLEKLGISVPFMRLEGNAVIMERIKFPTLMAYWLSKPDLILDDVINAFDRIKSDIDKTDKCYCEMCPTNIFYDTEKDNFIYFDQEFSDDLPKETAMARTVVFLLGKVNFKDSFNTAMERYGLTEEHIKKATEITLDILGNELSRVSNLNAVTERRRQERFKNIPNILKSKNLVKPIVYGNGQRGKSLRCVLMYEGIEAVAVVDKKFDENNYFFNDIEYAVKNTNSDCIIISVKDGGIIAEEFKKIVNLPIFTIEEILQ